MNVGGTYTMTIFRYRSNGTLEKVIARGDPAPGSGGGTIASFSQGPGAGRAGLFFFRAAVLNGPTFGDAVYGTTSAGQAGDVDGDAKSDITVYRPDTGTWYSVPSTAPGTFTATQWGTPTDIPVPADYDGDGTMDIAVWRPSTGTWYFRPSSAPGTFLSFQWGLATDIPVPGDYDGDGKTDLVVYRPSDGMWYALLSGAGYSAGSYESVQWGGMAGDVPVPGDYDGDGRTDVAVYRPSTGMWYILTSSSDYSYASYAAHQWGDQAAGDVPVPGDYDGDGKTDLGGVSTGEGDVVHPEVERQL